MARFVVSIDADGAAFDGFRLLEVARILREIAERVENGNAAGTARDLNGNTVAEFTFTTADG